MEILVLTSLFLSFALGLARRSEFSGIISFGDSFNDVGNNNYLPPVTVIARCNQRPYGRLFDTGVPTGRFTDGEIVSDIIAKSLGLKFAPAYLDPRAAGCALLQGVNFASGGAGLLDSTSDLIGSARLSLQKSWFRDYKSKLIALQGEQTTKEFLSSALYFYSAGSNDYAYKAINPSEAATEIHTFRYKLLENLVRDIREIYSIGARIFVIQALTPLGCLPGIITVYGGNLSSNRSCIEYFNAWALDFNNDLRQLISHLEEELVQAKFVILDPYPIVADIIQNPSRYGITVTNRGCCGTGTVEIGLTCNQAVGACEDGSKFVYFDAGHGSFATYKIVAEKLKQQLNSDFALFLS